MHAVMVFGYVSSRDGLAGLVSFGGGEEEKRTTWNGARNSDCLFVCLFFCVLTVDFELITAWKKSNEKASPERRSSLRVLG